MTRLLLAPWRWLVAGWTEPIRAEPLAAFRVLLAGTVLLSQLTGLMWQLRPMCGDDPLIPAATRDGWTTRSGRICLLRGPSSLPLLGEWLPDRIFGPHFKDERARLQNWVPEPTAKAWADWGTTLTAIYTLYAVYLVSLVGVMVGFRTRLMTLVALLLSATFNHRMAELLNGGDSLFRNGLWFLLLAPAGATWSVDAWLKGRRGPVFIEPWSVRLIQIQVALMYLFTGLTKLADLRPDETYGWWWPRGDWVDGTALYWVMNDVAIMRWSYASLPVPLWACRLATWGTLAFELLFWLLVLIRPVRPYVVALGLALHVGILVMMEIGWFSPITMCFYALFVPGERLAAFVRRFSGSTPTADGA